MRINEKIVIWILVAVCLIIFLAVMLEKKKERNEAPLEKAIVNLDSRYVRQYK